MTKADLRQTLLPNPALLAKLGSIAVHADELTSKDGHEFGAAALRSLLSDPEIVSWLDAMAQFALVPRKRVQP
jgi:hypothetical protein